MSSCLESQIINIKLKKNQQKVPGPSPKLLASDQRTQRSLKRTSYSLKHCFSLVGQVADSRPMDEQIIIAQMSFINLGQVHIWFRTSADAMLLVRRTSASSISRQPLGPVGISNTAGKCWQNLRFQMSYKWYCTLQFGLSGASLTLTTDDLLPILVFLIIKAEIANW